GPRVFEPPYQQDAGGGFTLYVKSALPDAAGAGAVATLELWNGTLKHTDRLPLSSDLARRRFVRAVEALPGGYDTSGLGGAVVQLLPPTAYVDYTGVSPRFLAYSSHDLRHRIVVLFEAGGLADGVGAYIMRSLLSEGRLKLGTVERSGGVATRRSSSRRKGRR